MKRILHLHLPRAFFAQIAAGTKRTEYRRQSPHWKSRLEGRTYDVILFRNGYAPDAPEMLVELISVRRITKTGQSYYALRLGRIMKLKRWKTKPRKPVA